MWLRRSESNRRDAGYEPAREPFLTAAMVVVVGIEPTRRSSSSRSRALIRRTRSPEPTTEKWSGQGDSNPTSLRWQRKALPLSYARELLEQARQTGRGPSRFCSPPIREFRFANALRQKLE